LKKQQNFARDPTKHNKSVEMGAQMGVQISKINEI